MDESLCLQCTCSWLQLNAAGLDETYGTYVDDDGPDHDTDDDTDDDADDVTNDGGRGNLHTIKVPCCCSWLPGPWSLFLDPWSSAGGH